MVRPDPKLLRDAADLTEQADTARKVALETEAKANTDKAKADTAETNADAALTAVGVNTSAGNAGNGGNGNVVRRGWLHNPDGEFRSGVVAAIAVIALILVLLLLGWVFYLANNKANGSQVEAVNSVAIAGGNQASETKGKVSVMEETLRHTTEIATGGLVKAESADANARNANDNAKLALKKATSQKQSTQTHVVQQSAKKSTAAHSRARQAEEVVIPASQAPTIRLWHHHDATATNPKPCVISEGPGLGLPPYCSSFKVQPVNAGETKNQWLVRAGGGGRPGDTGMYTKKD